MTPKKEILPDGMTVEYTASMRVYKNADGSGHTETYFPNGLMHEYQEYDADGVPHGGTVTHYDNGKLRHMIRHRHGVKDGFESGFSGQGLVFSGVWLDGKKDDEWMHYYANGEMSRVENYRDGQRHGLAARFYQSGAVAHTMHFENDREEGIASFFYPNGQPRVQQTMHLGVRHGPSSSFHEDGTPHVTTAYADGLENGTRLDYRKDGTLMQKADIRLGRKNGFFIQYHDDGVTPQLTAACVDGELSGPYRRYHADGSLFMDGSYARGLDHGVQRLYNDDRQVEIQMSYRDGKRHGATRLLRDNGNDWTQYNLDGEAVPQMAFWLAMNMDDILHLRVGKVYDALWSNNDIDVTQPGAKIEKPRSVRPPRFDRDGPLI